MKLSGKRIAVLIADGGVVDDIPDFCRELVVTLTSPSSR